MKKIMAITGFLPFIFIVAINAMTDLGHKITIQNALFKSFDGPELIMLTAITNALILLPFIFLFSPSGFISDKYPKTKVIRIASLFAIGISILITISYYLGLFWVAFGLTFVLAAQSAMYSPAKYGLIKEMFGNEKLAQGNGIIQAVTIMAILLGALLYSVAFEYLFSQKDMAIIELSQTMKDVVPLGFVLIISSIIEYLLALKLPVTSQEQKDAKFNISKYNSLGYLKENLEIIQSKDTVWLSIIGLSVFWGIAQVVSAIYGSYLKEMLYVTNTVVSQGLLAVSGLGIVAGSITVSRYSKNYIDTGIIPLGAIGMTVSLFLLSYSLNVYMSAVLFFAFGFFGGLFIVPLNSLIQFASDQKDLGKTLAGNNFIQNMVMFNFLALTAFAGICNISIHYLFYTVAFISLVGTFYTIYKLPQSLVRYIIQIIVSLKYDISVHGLDNIKNEKGKGTLLLGNHISFLDWAILQIGYPEQIRFVIERSYYNKWYFKPVLKFFNAIPVSSGGSKNALREIANALNNGDVVALFPEGHISRNGQLSEFQRGFEIIAQQTGKAILVPFYLHGLWESDFSYASEKLKNKGKKVLSVSFGTPLKHSTPKEVIKAKIMELSISVWNDYAKTLETLPNRIIQNCKEHSDKLCIADSTGLELDHNRFLTSVFLMANKWKDKIKDEQNIGLLVPTSVAGSITNAAVLCLGKTVVNLNFTTALSSLIASVNKANIETIITSKKFLKKLEGKGFDLDALLYNKKVIYLEETKKEISKFEMALQLSIVKMFSAETLSLFYVKPTCVDDTAAILFSSGSEGTPKGIELSHKNINGNIKQIISVLNPSDSDVILSSLPVFHSFGLTVTTLMPLLEGITSICHPDPTDAFGIGKLVSKYDITMLCATSTFLRLYTRNRKLHPLMFDSVKIVIAGAEKVLPEVRSAFKEKFGLNIYEGYGATETTPVASVNIPDTLMENWRPQVGTKIGTVGLPLPGTLFKIVDPQTFEPLEINESGMVLIGGTQIMKGYLDDIEKTNSVVKIINGNRWYVTGDKGKVDEDGFLTIVDRYSRFAKLGGEMVSLGSVEAQINEILSNEEIEILAVTLKDDKKGEKIVLLHTNKCDPKDFRQKLISEKLNALYVPSDFHFVSEIPKLGTGKTDFSSAKKLVEELS